MFTLDDDIMRQLRATFKVEAAEHIQAMNRVLLALEQNPEGEERAGLLEEIFREAHSLKGAAGAADLGEVERTAHRLENVFGAARTGKLNLSRDVCDVLYRGIDAVSAVAEAALEEQPHEIDLPSLYASLDALEQGRVVSPVKAADALPMDPSRPANVSASEPLANPAAPPAPVSAQSQAPAAPVPVAVSAAPPAPAEVNVAIRGIDSDPRSKAYKGEDRRKNSGLASVNEETIRVGTGKIDTLMAQAGELLVAGLKIDQHLTEIGELGHAIEEWNREWLKVRSAHSDLLHANSHDDLRPLLKLLEQSQERIRTLATQVGELQRGFSRNALHLSRVTNDLGEGVMRVRMLPVATVFDAFPRLVRDLSRETGKEVELITEGAETELDRKVLEEIKDPLIHILRNCVDHGIEKPEERLQAGKPRQGTLTVKAFQKGNNIVIEVADDGAGINRDKVKQAALNNGLISADDAQTLSDDEALRLIFTPGLSTCTVVTGTSGRGVGMDVVRKNVEALQGQVDVVSALGKGTTMTLTLSLTLATTQELLVQVGDQTYGIPISAVERIERVMPKDIAPVLGRQAIVVDGEPVSLVRLSAVLERPGSELKADSDSRVPVVILQAIKKRVAFQVDAVVGQQETVVKSLGKQLSRVRNAAGVTILGSGKVIMTLNPVDLMKSARGADNKTAPTQKAHVGGNGNGKGPVKQETKQRTLLVVDDSLSTRTLEKNILETAGYRVVTAADGLEAWNLLNSNGGCDLIVSDVMMPRMSGFELTAAVKKDVKLKKIPVVLVTSLDSRADKERGIEVGADAYIVKGNFDQSNLLQTVAQLI
jgi:two-component system chemotaxis sensor kinase CheA